MALLIGLDGTDDSCGTPRTPKRPASEISEPSSTSSKRRKTSDAEPVVVAIPTTPPEYPILEPFIRMIPEPGVMLAQPPSQIRLSLTTKQKPLDSFQAAVKDTKKYVHKKDLQPAMAWLRTQLHYLDSLTTTQERIAYIFEAQLESFQQFESCVLELLNVDQAFQNGFPKDMLVSFCEDLITLSLQVISLLIVPIDSRITAHQSQVPLLGFVGIARAIVLVEKQLVRDIHDMLNDWRFVEKAFFDAYTDHHLSTSLGVMVQMLLVRDHAITEADSAIIGMAKLLSIGPEPIPMPLLLNILPQLHKDFLPRIARAQPKAFPYAASTVHDFGVNAIEFFKKDPAEQDAKSLLPKTIDTLSLSPNITLTSLNQCSLVWQVSLCHFCLHSEFLQARCWAIGVLGTLIQYAHKDSTKRHGHGSHIDADLRFMRDILEHFNIIPYVFGPQSHVTILLDSGLLIDHFVLTGGWTNETTTCVWTAVMDNSEDGFTKTAFGMLCRASNHMSIDLLLFLVNKFAQASLQSLPASAPQCFEQLLLNVFSHADRSWCATAQLSEPAKILFEVIHNVANTPSTMITENLRRIALQFLQNAGTLSDDIAQQQAICERCATLIKDRTLESTDAIHLLCHYLKTAEGKDMPIDKLCSINLAICVAELKAFAMTNAQRADRVDLAPYQLRCDMIANLIATQPDGTATEDLLNTFWTSLEGGLADPSQRQHVLDFMLSINGVKLGKWSVLMDQQVLRRINSMTSTSGTISFVDYLRKRLLALPVQELNSHALWQHLLKIMLSTSAVDVLESTMTSIAEITLRNSSIGLINTAMLASFQQKFVANLLSDVNKSQDELGTSIQHVQRTFNLLTRLHKNDGLHGSCRTAILANCDALETMLERRLTAQYACNLLRELKYPQAALNKAKATTSEELCLMLSSQPWRVVHIQHLWQSQVLDPDERLQRLLIAVDLCLEDLSSLPPLAAQEVGSACLKLLSLMHKNLPRESAALEQGENPVLHSKLEQLNKHLLRQLRTMMALPAADDESTATLYQILLQACSIDSTLWTTMMVDEEFVALHHDLFCQAESKLFTQLAQDIAHVELAGPEVTKVFASVLAGSFPACLRNEDHAAAVCNLLGKFVAHESIQSDSACLTDICTALISALWTYQHTETMFNRLSDKALTLLLDMLIHILPNVMHSLDRNQLRRDIFQGLLFCESTTTASFTGISKRSLLQDVNRHKCYYLLYRLCADVSEHTDNLRLFHAELLRVRDHIKGMHRSLLRQPFSPNGLTNLGQTCYMNSLLQQIYGNITIRKHILDLKIDNPDQQKILVEVQSLFGNMQDCVKTPTVTADLASLMGINTNVQEDVHTFYTLLMGAIEDSISSPEERADFMKLYTGKAISQVRGACGHISPSDEPINSLSITVSDKDSLEQSLEEYFQPEALKGDNKYKCHTCPSDGDGVLVEAVKRTTLQEVPDNLMLCLKRCEWSMSDGSEKKNNDTFNFPETIDLAPYQQTARRDSGNPRTDNFKLVGVIIHRGTLSFGHYWSYVRSKRPQPSGEWIRFEDHRAEYRSYNDLYHEAVGGIEGVLSNAYMLFYEREDAMMNSIRLAEPNILSTQHDSEMPLRVPISAAQKAMVDEANQSTTWTMQLHSSTTSEFVFGTISAVLRDLRGSQMSPTVKAECCSVAAAFIGDYLGAIVLTKGDANDLAALIAEINELLDLNPEAALPILISLSNNTDLWARIFYYSDQRVWTDMIRLIIDLLRYVKLHSSQHYGQAASRVLETTDELMKSRAIDSAPACLESLFEFMKSFTDLGEQETKGVFSTLTMDFVVETTRSALPSNTQARHLVPKWPTDFIAMVYKFMHGVMKNLQLHNISARLDDLQNLAPRVFETFNTSTGAILPWLSAMGQHNLSPMSPEDDEIAGLVSILCMFHDPALVEIVRTSLIDMAKSDSYPEVLLCVVQHYIKYVHAWQPNRMLIRFALTAAVGPYNDAEAVDRHILDFLERAIDHSAWAVIGSINAWFPKSAYGNKQIKQRCLEHLDAVLNYAEPLSDGFDDNTAPDVYRLGQVCDLFKIILSMGTRAVQNWYLREALGSCVDFASRLQACIEERSLAEYQITNEDIWDTIKKIKGLALHVTSLLASSAARRQSMQQHDDVENVEEEEVDEEGDEESRSQSEVTDGDRIGDEEFSMYDDRDRC